MDKKFIGFQKYVTEYMAKFPEKFEIVFEEFDEEGFVLESKYQDGKAIFRVNLKEWDKEVWRKDDVKSYAKDAIFLFLDEVFYGSNDESIPEERLNLFKAIAYLIP